MKFKILFIFLLVSGIIFSQKAERFLERIYFDGKGNNSAVFELKISENNSTILLIPLNLNSENIAVKKSELIFAENETPEAINAGIKKKDGLIYIEINLDSVIRSYTLGIELSISGFFSFTDEEISDFGNYSLKRVFKNTSLTEIKNFTTELILPIGYNVTSVTETIPKQKSEETDTPYKISKVDGRTSLQMKAQNLKLGDNVIIGFRFKESQKSYLLLYILLIVAVLYLYYFRELVHIPKAEKTR